MSNPGSPTGPTDPQPEPGPDEQPPQTPPPPGPPPPPHQDGQDGAAATAGASGGSPTEPVSGTAGEPPEPPKRRRGLVVGTIPAVVILLVPGAVFAWRALDGGGPQPDDVLPADAIGYVRVDLDPSASQKIAAFRFLRKFPAFTDATGIKDDGEDLRERLVEQFAASTGCDIDFESDIDPWAGDRLGVAILPGEDDDGEPEFAIALQTSDEEAAEDALSTVLSCAGAGDDNIGRAFLDGYMIISDTQERADRYVDAAQESALSENDDYVNAMDRLGDPGIASLWVSGTGMFDEFGETASSDVMMEPAIPAPEEMIEEGYADIAVAFRFDDSYAEVATVASGSIYEEFGSGGVQADVPDTTVALLGFSGGGDYLRDNWDSVLDAYGEEGGEIDQFVSELGLTLPDDLATVIGDSLLVALDAEGLNVDAVESMDPTAVRLGLKVATDADAAEQIWQKLQDAAAEAGESLDAVPLTFTDDGYIVSTQEDYAAELAEGGSLADSDAYSTVVKDKDDADGVFFVNFDVIEDAVLPFLEEQGLSESEVESLRTLQALGFSTHVRDGYAEVTLRVSAE